MAKAKNRILQASYELFAEKDFDKITIPDILERASICRGTFYNNFSDKYELLYRYCLDMITREVLCRYNGHNWEELQADCFELGNRNRGILRSLRNTTGADEFWFFIHQFFAGIFRSIKLHNSGDEAVLTDIEQLTIDNYVNSFIYLFRRQLVSDDPVSGEDLSAIICRGIPDEYIQLKDPGEDPAGIIITEPDELIRNIYSSAAIVCE